MRLRLLWNAFLLGDWVTFFEPVTNFLQRVWPFSRWDFTEAAHKRRKILTRLENTREEFYADPEVREQILGGEVSGRVN